jgi:hypothetical protein
MVRRSTSSSPEDYEPGNVGGPPDRRRSEHVDDDDEPVDEAKGKRRPYAERIAELDDKIAYMTAERRRLSIEHLAERLKEHEPLRPVARKLRALLRAGMHEKCDAFAAESEATLASHTRKPTGPA